MNREQRRASLKAIGGKKQVNDPNRSVTRQELVDAITQVGENVGQVQQGLVEAVNTMYGHHVFPLQFEESAIRSLLVEKGILTDEEIEERVKEQKQEILDRAQQIKEGENGNIELVPEEEAKENEKKAVVKASAESSKEKKENKSTKEEK